MVSGELSHERTSRETEKPCLFYPHTKKRTKKETTLMSPNCILQCYLPFQFIPLSLNLHYTAFRSIQNNKNIINSQFNHGPAAHQIYNSIENVSVLIINLCLNTKSHSHYYQFHWFKTCFTWAHVKALLQLPKFEHHIDYHWPYGSTYVYSRLGKSFSNLNSTAFFYLTFRQISNGWLQTDTNTEL